MLEFLRPVEHFGRKFDRAMTLFEFDALREPEKTRFPQIGAWLRAKGIEFNEVPTPSMLWRGKLWPDLYIANQLEAVHDGFRFEDAAQSVEHSPKSDWTNTGDFEMYSKAMHGKDYHHEFIEPMCRKITGRSSSEIAAKYHRAIWLPLYWPQTLRARASIRTPFYYPAAGYAGAIRSCISGSERTYSESSGNVFNAEGVSLSVAYVVATIRSPFSVLFVVDDSPIYRITDMDVCAGIACAEHRLIVEFRGECSVSRELRRLGIVGDGAWSAAFDRINLTLPTLDNVRNGWTPRPHINDRLWSILNAETSP